MEMTEAQRALDEIEEAVREGRNIMLEELEFRGSKKRWLSERAMRLDGLLESVEEFFPTLRAALNPDGTQVCTQKDTGNG